MHKRRATSILSSCLTKIVLVKIPTTSKIGRNIAFVYGLQPPSTSSTRYGALRVPTYVINLIYYLCRGKSAISPLVWTKLPQKESNEFRIVWFFLAFRPRNVYAFLFIIIIRCRMYTANGHSAVANNALCIHTNNECEEKHIHDEWLTATEHVSGTKSAKELRIFTSDRNEKKNQKRENDWIVKREEKVSLFFIISKVYRAKREERVQFR